MDDRSFSFLRAWAWLFGVHAGVTAAITLVSKFDLPGWLRDPLGVFAVFTLYGPIALVTKLGATRATFERAAWMFGELTPAGWALVIAGWLVAHAAIASAWVALRRRDDRR